MTYMIGIDNEIALFGAKLWGKGNKDLSAAKEDYAALGTAPRTNFTYETEKNEEGRGSSLSDG